MTTYNVVFYVIVIVQNLLKLFVGIIEGEGGLLAWCDLVPGVEEASLVLSIVF